MDDEKRATSTYWDRRMNRDSPPLTLAEFVFELNRQLFDDPGYEPGTRFLLGRSESGAEFPTWEGPAKARSLIHRVLQSATRQAALPVPFRMDGFGPPEG